jgi:type III secretion protein T
MSDDYASVFLNSALSRENPLAAMSLLFLFLARFLPILALAPFFGAKVLPHPVKMTLAFSMFVIYLPQLLSVVTTSIGFDLFLVLLILKEIFIGFIMGYIVSMPFIIAQNTGIIIDHQRGGASLMVNDPTMQNQSSPLGTLFNMVLIYVFFYIDGPFLFFEAFTNSYQIIPPDRLFNPNFFLSGTPFWEMQIGILNKVMVLTIQLASPALIAILMTDAFLGIANRLAPQVQITFLGMPLKSLLALVVICIGWKLYNVEVVRQVYLWLNTMNSMIQMFSIAT